MSVECSIPLLIEKKRDGIELSKDDIKKFVTSVVDGSIQDSQIGAMLMAIYLKGMSTAETVELTRSMAFSGQVFSFPESWSDLLVDKHSTGGVGDKISLVLAPAMASLGFKVPMVSGRGLGHTGGTLDKLESIPGYKTKLTQQEMTSCLESAGCFIAGATSALAPADAVLYQQRDVTSTVGCLPLIVSSILSKKVAEGTKALVMDVKVGGGALFKDVESARQISDALVKISAGLGVTTRVAITRMDHPLGRAVGNAVEVEEAVECLRGGGPDDVNDLVNALGAYLLIAKGRVKDLATAKAMVAETTKNGSALKKFKEMLVQQGVSENTAEQVCYGDIKLTLPQAPYVTSLQVESDGYVHNIDAMAVGLVSWSLGAGRSKATDSVDHSVGVKLSVQVGDKVKVGENWIDVLHSSENVPSELLHQLKNAITIKTDVYARNSIIVDVI